MWRMEEGELNIKKFFKIFQKSLNIATTKNQTQQHHICTRSTTDLGTV